ncbi:MAG: carbohydrate ABC transporter substrate-binding protein [Oscillospiraceae bacterium]|nr:carbohydrate ABC transporter substrate-binding protein [Oscillospiraceae bacterium]
MKKRILTALLASAMILSVAGCDSTTDAGNAGAGDTTTTTTAKADDGAAADTTTEAATPDDGAAAADQGKVLNIYCWNTEFQGLFEKYAADLVPADTTVNWVINTNEGGVYQNKLDEALLAQQDAAADDKVDIFLIEADYALKYTASPYCMNIKDLGITDADLANQYAYTQQVATSGGNLKAVSWQATPGLFAYRRSIAKEVLGTDDPTEVQAQLSDWTKFEEVAGKMKAAGYTMLAGYADAYRTFSNNVSAPWVVDGNLTVDANIMKWADMTKKFQDNGYSNPNVGLWSGEWATEQGPAGKTFGFFYSTWGINFTLLGNSLATPVADGGKEEVGNGIYGDYAVCEGPQAYYWGGTWICAAQGTDNTALIADVMKRMTCDTATMKQITMDTQDYTNNSVAMNELANDPSFGSAFLGGQNHIALFASAAPNIDCSNMYAYDQIANEQFQECMKDYFNGEADQATALNNFYAKMKDTYPELTVPQA